MKLFTSIILILLLSCNNSGNTITNQKDSLDSLDRSQKHIIDSAADKSREQVDSIEKAGKKMVDSTITTKKWELQKKDSINQKK